MRSRPTLLIFPVFIFLVFSHATTAQAGPVPVEKALDFKGQNCTVTGTVYSVSKAKSGDVYLNFGGAYPNHIFSIQIRAQNAGPFGDTSALKNKAVEVTGMVEVVSSKPLISISTPGDLKILEGTKPVDPTSSPAPASPPPPVETVTTASPRTLLGVAYGSFGTFTAPLSDKGKKEVRTDGNPSVDQATIGLGVPANFDPAKPARLLLMYTTSDTDFSAVERARNISRTALAEGWLVMGADGTPVKPPKITTEWVTAMTQAGLEALEREIPAAKKWKIATAGNSGGATMAGLVSAWVNREGYDLSGIFLSACHGNPVEEGIGLFRPNRKFRDTPVFISVGTDDKVAPPELSRQLEKSLKSSGFDHIRCEEFSGGHYISYEEAAKALRWFNELEGNP